MDSIYDRMTDVSEFRLAPIPWGKFRTEIEAMYQPPMVRAATRGKMMQVLREIESLGVQTTADLTAPLVARYVSARPSENSPHTLRSLLSVLRVICSYAYRSGYLRVNPFDLRRLSRWVGPLPPPGRGLKRHNSRDEIARVLALAAKDVQDRQGWAQWRSRRLQAVLAICAYMGMRKNEILRLKVDDVDLNTRVIWIRPNGKALKTAASCAPSPFLSPFCRSSRAGRLTVSIRPTDTPCQTTAHGSSRRSVGNPPGPREPLAASRWNACRPSRSVLALSRCRSRCSADRPGRISRPTGSAEL